MTTARARTFSSAEGLQGGGVCVSILLLGPDVFEAKNMLLSLYSMCAQWGLMD